MADVENVNKGDAETRRTLLEDPVNDLEPQRQRPVQEDTEPKQRFFETSDGTIVRTSHKPGTPRPEDQAVDLHRQEAALAANVAESELHEVHPRPETPSADRVYAERPNIVHPGPTVEAVIAAEERAGEPIPADPEVVLRNVDGLLEPGETAEERLEARKEAIRAERVA